MPAIKPRWPTASPHVSARDCRALVLLTVSDLRKYSVDGSLRRGVRRARVLFTRGWRNSREHALDLAIQALSDAPRLLGYGQSEVNSFLTGQTIGNDRLIDPGMTAICRIGRAGVERDAK